MNLAGDMNSIGGWFRYFFQPQGMAAAKKRNTSGHVYWGWEFFICILCSDENNISIMNILFPALPFTRSINQPTNHPPHVYRDSAMAEILATPWLSFFRQSLDARQTTKRIPQPTTRFFFMDQLYEARFSRLV